MSSERDWEEVPEVKDGAGWKDKGVILTQVFRLFLLAYFHDLQS
jgi:hypothetical protein